MKKGLKKVLSNLFIASFIFSYTSQVLAEEMVSDYLMEPMPNWYSERFTRGHLDINKMVKKGGYTRAEAVEIQNQMKDILDQDQEYEKLEKSDKTYNLVKAKDAKILEALKKAIKIVKEDKVFESGFKAEKLKENEFYVVFDLDETLLVQWYEAGLKGDKFYDAKADSVDNILKPTLLSPNYVSLTPGFEKALKDISKIPGNKGIIFFSAKLDKATYDIIEELKIDGKPIKSFIKGLYTRNYLVRENEPSKLSKDLRIIDDSLKHLIIIDDNPTRILEKQKKNLREIPKYNPDEYLNAKLETKNTKIQNYFEGLLPVVVDEIKEAADYAEKNKISFVEAYYPYSADANAELLMLLKQGYNMKEAIKMIRENMKIFEPKFFFYEEKNN